MNVSVGGEYRAETKDEWLVKMRRYYSNDASKGMAIDRVTKIISGGCWDWDDNVSEEWAAELAQEWGLL